jgi:diguanylate cyclase (GGDEF)-like protein
MPAAAFPILVNICVAGMFVGSFLTIAQLNPGFRHLRWFALCFAVGMITPVADLLLPLSSWPMPLTVASDAGVFVGIVLMGPAIAMLYGRPAPWGAAGALLISSAILRVAIWDGPRTDLWYQLTYQSPFAAAALFCAVVVARHGQRTVLDRVAFGLFAAISAHFLVKPFAAAHFGNGETASEYVNTTYAMISQVSSGILLVAAGLLVLINAFQMVILRDRSAALSDPLTGLPNRRALREAFEHLTSKNVTGTQGIAIIDVDHFKAVNDNWGHDAGDEVLKAVASCLDDNRPSNATIFRLGGEEFVLLVPQSDADLVYLACEKLRLSVSQLAFRDIGGVTISIGATTIAKQEDMSVVLRRADRALYAAKAAGRDQCVFQSEMPNTTVQTPHSLEA